MGLHPGTCRLKQLVTAQPRRVRDPRPRAAGGPPSPAHCSGLAQAWPTPPPGRRQGPSCEEPRPQHELLLLFRKRSFPARAQSFREEREGKGPQHELQVRRPQGPTQEGLRLHPAPPSTSHAGNLRTQGPSHEAGRGQSCRPTCRRWHPRPRCGRCSGARAARWPAGSHPSRRWTGGRRRR